MPLFSIFIPTFNRADILPRTLDSITAQQDDDIEVVIVDDGSNDDTHNLIMQWQQSVGFPVKYLFQPNQGKTAAHNSMLRHARGELTVLLNSDDLLAENTLATLRHYWQQIKDTPGCAGIEGLSADLETGELLGSAYPQDEMWSNYLAMRQTHGVKGDKLNAIKTSVLRKYPFPRFPGEKHVPPSTVWSRIARHYTFLHINQVLQYKEYRDDGITKAWGDKKTRNPCGYRQFYLEILNEHRRYYSLRSRLSAARRYVYLSLLCGTPFKRQVNELGNRLLFSIAYPFGAGKYLLQRLKKIRHNGI
ncbi:MAG: glycosyltransferase family A protein [Gammaproteobacteria bacterium]|nr:glycosyltransferase family A protein [Gammaproteobacteria bacterium]